MKSKIIRAKQKIKNMFPKYNHNKYIIGNINNNCYVQFIPILKGYHQNKDKTICVFILEDIDKRKTFKCPKCNMNLTNQIIGQLEAENEFKE